MGSARGLALRFARFIRWISVFDFTWPFSSISGQKIDDLFLGHGIKSNLEFLPSSGLGRDLSAKTRGRDILEIYNLIKFVRSYFFLLIFIFIFLFYILLIPYLTLRPPPEHGSKGSCPRNRCLGRQGLKHATLTPHSSIYSRYLRISRPRDPTAKRIIPTLPNP